MFADDTQQYTNIDTSSPDGLSQLTACVGAVTGWFSRNDLLLNPNKIEAIITGTRQQLAKFNQSDVIIVSGSNVPFVRKPCHQHCSSIQLSYSSTPSYSPIHRSRHGEHN